MAQHDMEGGKMQGKEEKLKILMGKDIEGGETVSKAEAPSDIWSEYDTEASKREMLSTLMEENEIVNTADMPNNAHEEYYVGDDFNLEELRKRGMVEWDYYPGPGNFQELYRAAMNGNWQDARAIFLQNERPKTAKISNLGMTALHVAASCGQSEFVVELVKILSPEQLEAKDQVGRTALHHVALAANVSAAKALVNVNPDLPHLGDIKNLTPLFYAAKWRHPSDAKEMVDYLHLVTKDRESCLPFTGDSAADLIVAITVSRSYDTVLCTLKRYPELAFERNSKGMSVLRALAMQPLAFRSGYELSTWESWIYDLVQVDMEETEHEHKHSPTDVAKSKNLQDAAALFCKFTSKFNAGISKVSKIKQRHLQALRLVEFVCEQLKREDINSVEEYFIPQNDTPILHLAIEHGVFELVQECLDRFPDLIWYADPKTKWLLFHAAIGHRRVEIFNHLVALIGNNTKAYADVEDDGERNNCLHLAAKLAPPPQLNSVPGPAFQMQREFQWFKAVESIVYYDLRTEKNSAGKTPRELFFDDHKNLQQSAKEWVRDTLNSCMVVATLVATVAFAAMITVPGGNDSGTGIPLLARKNLFAVFSVSNALSMISSVVSLLMFLSLQTSRYTEEDFLESLPKTLVRALVLSSIAVVFMMISFGTAIALPLESRLDRAYIPVTIVVVCLPSIIFARWHFPLLLENVTFRSGPPIIPGQRDRKLWRLKNVCYRLLTDDMV